MRIYLLGMMGSGKSTVGKKLANKLSFQFHDLDDLIEAKLSMSIADFFEKEGEDKFRIIEQVALRETFLLENVVISTGGGAPCFFSNISEINEHGLSCYLEADIGLLISRLQGATEQRPLLKNFNTDTELRTYLQNLLSQREFFYKQAKRIVPAIDVTANKLARVLGLD
ncbi:MAG: shikimate kinase [Bacteroidales bacterium]|nr:shikimate kinase [Bacteroidales bacterium]